MTAQVATAVPTRSTGPDRRVLVGVAWRTALVVLALIGVLVGLPAWGRAPLSVLAALAVGGALVGRLRAHGLLRALAIAVGGAVVVLALLGLVLNVLPGGLATRSWGIGAAVVELATLAVVTLVRPGAGSDDEDGAEPVSGLRRIPLAAAVWTLVVLAVLAGAVTWAVTSFDATHVRPVALEAEDTTATGATVVVSSGSDAGPYDLVLVTSAGRRVIARDVEITAGRPYRRTVALPANDRALLQLVPDGAANPVRQLILTAGTSR